MSDDLLQRTTEALRAVTTPHRDGMDAMLARISESKANPQFGRRRAHAVLIALAATFLGLGAWAQVTGRLPDLSGALFPSAQKQISAQNMLPPQKRARDSRVSAPRALPSAVAPRDPPAAEPPPPSSAKTPPPQAKQSSKSRGTAPPVTSGRALPAPAPVDVDALYLEAHRAHFSGRDYARAIEAWDRYLAAAGPSAKLSLEARYNRAIALARSSRGEEAVNALRPFAEGSYGGYRRAEARQLMDSLLAGQH